MNKLISDYIYKLAFIFDDTFSMRNPQIGLSTFSVNAYYNKI